MLVIADTVRLVAARAFSTRALSGWRPLLWFWLFVLAVIVAGGAVLRYLGPPAEHPAGEQMRSESQQSTAPVTPEPRPTPASASAAVPLPRQPDVGAPSPPRPHPAPDAQAVSGANQASANPSSQPRIVLHPAGSSNGTAVAEQLASQLGLASDQITVGTVADAGSRAIIRFYAAEDHPLARRLGSELAQMGYAWRIDNFGERPSTASHQPLEIWLPKR